MRIYGLMKKELLPLRRLARLSSLRRFAYDGHREKSDFVVSLTSYGNRLRTVGKVVLSMLDQDVLPKEIVLYVSEESPQSLPATLVELTKYNFRIVYGVKDVLSHKKYYYSFLDYPDDPVITIDDDCLYPRDFIRSFYKVYQQDRHNILARRVNLIKYDSDGNFLPYDQWEMEYTPKDNLPSKDYLATGVGGILYPPGEWRTQACDEDMFMELAPKADDLWLKYVEERNDRHVRHIKTGNAHPIPIIENDQDALCIYNVIMGGNNIAMERLSDYFGLYHF